MHATPAVYLGILLGFASAPAFALAPSTLPARSDVIYTGLGLSTFQYGSSGLIRDRQIRPSADLVWGHGLTDNDGLWVDLHGTMATVIEDPSRGPCPRNDDYCDDTISLGQSGITYERQLVRKPLLLKASVSARTDAWNASTRSRWTNVGQGTSSLVGLVDAGKRWETGWEVAANVGYRFVFGRRNERFDLRTPADEFTAKLAGAKAFGKLTIEVGTSTNLRLGGVEFSEWTSTWLATEDRWSALQYRELVGHGKLSVSLPMHQGLHLYIGRTVWAENGPKDTLHTSFGWHKYFAPHKRDD